MGLSPWVLVEVSAALALLGVLLSGSLVGTAFARWSVALAIMVMLAATLDHGRRLKQRRHRRALTEGGRPAAYVQYQGHGVRDTASDELTDSGAVGEGVGAGNPEL